MRKNSFLIIIILTLVFGASSIFAIYRKQGKLAEQFFATINQPANIALQISSSASSYINQEPTEAQQIEALRREVEELKKQSPKVIYKTILTPAEMPNINLKTGEELNKAKEQINSLEQKLREVQAQKSQIVQAANDADLIKSWQAEGKVVQVACENKLLSSWQLGSGVLIGADGKILTNQHVVQPAVGSILPDYCLILFQKDFESQTNTYKKEYRATITGFFNSRDAALLQIKDIIYKDQNGVIQSSPSGGSFSYFLPVLKTPQIGEAVYVIGYPESSNFSFSVTKGIISNYTSNNVYFGTDAQIDRGNSGGAALNSDGQLIGLPTYKFVNSGDYRGYILDINSIKW